MAITKIDFPTASTAIYTPDIETDYNNQNEYIERNARGYNAISLTNWDATTTKPQIAAGSVIEINGSTWDITTATDISTSAASSGTIYLYFDDGTPEFKFLDTAPTWSATLNGWYTSGDRFMGHVIEWDGSSSYTEKRWFSHGDKNYNLAANNFSLNDSDLDSTSISRNTAGSDEYILTAGVHYYYFISTANSDDANVANGTVLLRAYVKDATAWVTIQECQSVEQNSGGTTVTVIKYGMVISDGTNYKITQTVAETEPGAFATTAATWYTPK